jgi:hypothetical protein
MESGVTDKRLTESAIRQWLRSHYGVITWEEALRLGAAEGFIRSRLRSGAWIQMHRGVYCDNAVPRTPYQQLRAAWVATRGCGVVSHSSAGWLWNLLSAVPLIPELTVPIGGGPTRRPQGLIIHRSRDLDLATAVSRHDVLVTNPMRTIVDLAATIPAAQLNGAIDTALGRRLMTLTALLAEVDRLSKHGRPGVGRLRWHLQDRGFIGAPAPSVLESRMYRLVLATHLPLPTVEVTVDADGVYRLDITWPPVHFAVEVDGYVWHFTPEQHQRDLNRRNKLQEEGWTIRVYTWRDVCDEPARVAREIMATYNRLADAADAAQAEPGPGPAKTKTKAAQQQAQAQA